MKKYAYDVKFSKIFLQLHLLMLMMKRKRSFLYRVRNRPEERAKKISEKQN